MADVAQGYRTDSLQEAMNATTAGNAIAEAGRLQAEAERDRYKAALEQIARLATYPGCDAGLWLAVRDARDALATPAGEGADA